MLQNQNEQTTLHGFIVGAELTPGVDLQQVVNKLGDALQFVEGVGRIDVEYLGQIELKEPEPNTNASQGDGCSPTEWPANDPTPTTSEAVVD